MRRSPTAVIFSLFVTQGKFNVLVNCCVALRCALNKYSHVVNHCQLHFNNIIIISIHVNKLFASIYKSHYVIRLHAINVNNASLYLL